MSLSVDTGGQAQVPSATEAQPKPERPSSLGPGKLTRRLLCYHNDHCMSHNSPTKATSPTSPGSVANAGEGDSNSTGQYPRHGDPNSPPAIPSGGGASETTSKSSPSISDAPPKIMFQSLTGRGTPPPDRHNNPNALTLSELPEPPIPVSEIGPIPPPPMFSSPSPTLLIRQEGGIHNAVPLDLSDFGYEGKFFLRTWNVHWKFCIVFMFSTSQQFETAIDNYRK